MKNKIANLSIMINAIYQDGYCILKTEKGFEIMIEFDANFVQCYEFEEPMPETLIDCIETAFEYYHKLINEN